MSDTVEREFTIRAELGLHARPAGLFVSMADRFASEISVSRVGESEEWIDGRSVLSLLSLAAGRGCRLRLRATGPDAAETVEALGRLLVRPNIDTPG